MYNTEIMQELILVPTFGCVVPNTHPFYSKFLKEKECGIVTCNDSPNSMLVLFLSIFKQYIHENNTIEFPKSMYSNSHCIRKSVSCCRRDTPASKPQVYMSANLANMTETVWTSGSFAQAYSGLKGLFLPCVLWNGGVEGICENVNCLAI